MTVRLVLADDHHVVRRGLRALLDAQIDFLVVGEAADGIQALELVEQQQPEILIVDLMMPNLNGLEVVRRISQSQSPTRCIVLSMQSAESYILKALHNGAWGYVLKDSTDQDLIQAVQQVAAGSHYLSPSISQHAIDLYIHKARESLPVDPLDRLTNREREILQLSAEGLTSPDIAARLTISPRTVETHRANLMSKLGLNSQTDLIRFAIKHGLIE